MSIKVENNKIYINQPLSNKRIMVGIIRGDEFVKVVNKRNQRLQKPPAYCLDEDVYSLLMHDEQIERVVVDEKFSGKRLTASMDDWLSKGMRINRGNSGPQVCLMINYWEELL